MTALARHGERHQSEPRCRNLGYDDLQAQNIGSGVHLCELLSYAPKSPCRLSLKTVVAVKRITLGGGFEEGCHSRTFHQRQGRGTSAGARACRTSSQKGSGGTWRGNSEAIQVPSFNFAVPTSMNAGIELDSEIRAGSSTVSVCRGGGSHAEYSVQIANDSDVGVAGYVHSRHKRRCWRVAEALKVGMVGPSIDVFPQTLCICVPFACD